MICMKKNQKRGMYCIFTIIFALLSYLILRLIDIEYQNWLTAFACIIVLSLCLNVLFLRRRGYKVVSFLIIFVALLYLFHFGQVILYGFFPSYETTGYNFIKKGTQSVINALLFSYLVINFIVAGSILVNKPKDNKSVRLLKRKQYKFIALFFICVSFPMQLYIVIKSIIASQALGYGESLHLGFSGAYSQIANFYIVGFVMLLILNKNNHKRKNFIFLLEICFLLFTMLSGSRIYAMTAMLVIFIVYFYNSHLAIRQKIILFVALVLILQFIVVIAKVRETAGFSFELILRNIIDLKNNVFLSILEEFGSSIASVYITVEQVPSSMQFSFGITYLKSLAGILVNIPGIDLYSFVDSACYIKQLSGTLAYGGSLIGELYYNFGFLVSLPVSFLIGYVAGSIDRKTSYYLSKGLNLELPMLVMVLYSHIIWVRGYFSNIVRAVGWAAILIYILFKLSKNRFFKKRGKLCNQK